MSRWIVHVLNKSCQLLNPHSPDVMMMMNFWIRDPSLRPRHNTLQQVVHLVPSHASHARLLLHPDWAKADREPLLCGSVTSHVTSPYVARSLHPALTALAPGEFSQAPMAARHELLILSTSINLLSNSGLHIM